MNKFECGGVCVWGGVGVCVGGVWVRLFSPTNEDTHLTFSRRRRTHKKNRGRPRFFKACRESYTAQTCIWGVGPPLVVIYQGPRCGG